MKKVVHFLITLAALAALGYVLWLGIRKHEEKLAEAPKEEATAEEEKPAEYTVMLEKKKAKALAIEKDQPQKTQLQPRCRAFGSVLDPSPLMTLDGELSAAEAALAASKADNERTQTLVASNDASRKAAESSAAQFTADKVKVEGLVRSAQLQWGAVFSGDPAKRRKLIDDLVRGDVALIRVDVMPGEALAELPKSARVLVMGREEQPVVATEIIPATAADPKTQAQGFILRADKPPFTLRPGMALTAWLELPEKPIAGYAIPRSAILRHDGQTWVYVQEEEEKYVRKPIVLGAPLEGDQGWFVAESSGISTDDVIVVTGAASLLSEELKAQGGGAPD